MSGETILLLEDTAEILKTNKRMLELHGYSVWSAVDVGEARYLTRETLPDLMVLDILLPDGSGLAFCREIRERADVPILFLTALGENADIVEGLRAGGDDYLPKPYDYDVFLARVEALLRRTRSRQHTEPPRQALALGPLRLELSTMRGFLEEKDLLLTPKEFLTLLTLAQREGEEVASDTLYQSAWGDEAGSDTRAVRTQVSRLRAKLGCDDGGPFTLAAKYGRGYVLRRRETEL